MQLEQSLMQNDFERPEVESDSDTMNLIWSVEGRISR